MYNKERKKKKNADKRKQTEPLPVSVGPIAMSSRHYTTASSSHSIYSDFQDDSPSSESMEASSYTESEMDASEFNAREPSIFSFSSSRDARQLLKESEGRVFNAQSDVYYLPADEDEFDRLGLQHRIHYHVFNALYPGGDLVDKILAPEWGVEKAVLDVGSGPGHWAIEMAKKFPHVHVVGVDLAPRTDLTVLPSNLRIEFDDANLGFPHYHGCFDFVHCRSMSGGISDRNWFFKELERCLRPGGAILVIDCETPILDHNKQPMKPAPLDGEYPQTRGWMARIMDEAGKDFAARGASPVFGNIAGLYSRALVATGGLPNPVAQIMYIPLGPWPVGNTEAETRWIRHLGEMMRRNALEFTRSLRPTLKSRGFSDEEVSKMIFGAEREMLDLSVWMYTRWGYVYAVKPK